MLDALEHVAEAEFFHLLVKDFLEGLPEQYVIWFIFIEYIEQETRRSLEVTGFLMFTGITLEDQSTDHRNVPELSLRHFGCIHAALDIFHEVVEGKQFIHIAVINRYGLVAQELEAVVVHGQGKSDGSDAPDPVGQHGRHGFMDQPSFEWINKEVKAIPGFNLFNQQFVGLWYMGDGALEFKQ